jgi:hypothetical protein
MTKHFWAVPMTADERQRVQDSWNDAVGQRMRDLSTFYGKDTDAARRHEQRLIEVAEALRVAASSSNVLSAEAPIEEMAAAAVSIYEGARGR